MIFSDLTGYVSLLSSGTTWVGTGASVLFGFWERLFVVRVSVSLYSR